MRLLADVGHVESCFGLFGDSVIVGARLVYGLRQTYYRLRKSFWKHSMVLLGDEAQAEACLGPFGYSEKLYGR